MGRAVPENDLPGVEVPASDLPGAVDTSKYGGAFNAAGTFLANAINSATFGIPDYLNKKFTPETYAEGEKYKAANPIAATAGDVAGYAVPVGAGIIKGGQLGAKATGSLLERFAPEIARGDFSALAKLYGRATGASTGGTMGAQAAAGMPEMFKNNPAGAVAASEMVNQYANQIPGISPLGGVTGHVVPAGYAAWGAAQDAVREKNRQDLLKMQMQNEAARRVLGNQ